jgi:hypothetical protein
VILYVHLIPELRALGTQRVPSLSCSLSPDLTRAPDAREEFPPTYSNKRHLIVSQLTALCHDALDSFINGNQIEYFPSDRLHKTSRVNDEALLQPGKAGGLIEQGRL